VKCNGTSQALLRPIKVLNILKHSETSTSHVTPEYDKLIAEKIRDIRHYVWKVIRKNTNAFFQLKHFFFNFCHGSLRIKRI